MRTEIIDFIFKIAKEKNAFDQLEEHLLTLTKERFTDNLIDCGILPEMFDHDSSEEKIWAKFSDIMLSKALNYLGIQAEVLGARGNSADVFGKATNYTIVGDAKTFRLSRTAKNQKDFKVNALDSWRKGNNYALLASPLMQYPNTKSQIYAQAIEKNVTLLSYTHLHFLIDFYDNQDLTPVWETGKRLRNTPINQHQSSDYYWSELDAIVVSSVGKSIIDLNEYKTLEITKTKIVGQEGIHFWIDKIQKFNKLSKEEAIKMLIKSEKIEAKIKTIAKASNIKITI
jgi:type II restriction enzyme